MAKEYKYANFIRTPDAMGASSAGNLGALSNDVKAIIGYVDVLLTGRGPAQTVSPLGNNYFMDTNAKCTGDGAQQPRFVYINNIPDGKIPLMPGNNKDLRGLVPGLMEGLGYMDPSKLFSAFSKDNKCQRVTMNTRDENNVTSTQSEYVMDSDLKDYNPCWFTNKRNPVTGAGCNEGFTERTHIPKDPIVQTYALGVGLLLSYLIYRVVQKKN